jgi:hypothetical protein
MKRFEICLLALVVVFELAIVQAYANSYPYESWCRAVAYGVDYDKGPTYAYAKGKGVGWYGEAEARANGWGLGGRSYGYYYKAGPMSVSDLHFTQWFRVTEVGPASINFTYDGYLAIDGENVEGGGYIVTYFVHGHSYFEKHYSKHDYKSHEHGFGTWSYSDSDSWDYDFTEDDIGTEFPVSFRLLTIVAAGTAGIGEGGWLALTSDFYDSFKVTEVTGGLEAVPIPATVLLLGSGLFGLAAIRRRRQSNI